MTTSSAVSNYAFSTFLRFTWWMWTITSSTYTLALKGLLLALINYKKITSFLIYSTTLRTLSKNNLITVKYDADLKIKFNTKGFIELKYRDVVFCRVLDLSRNSFGLALYFKYTTFPRMRTDGVLAPLFLITIKY